MHRRPRSSRKTLLALLLAALLLLPGCSMTAADHQLRLMVPNSPGGGYDVTGRTAVKITETAGITDPVPVFNLSGAGGALALTRLLHETGNSDLLMMMGLGVIGATVTDKSTARVTDATPIARLIEEQEAVMVPAGSGYGTIGELIAAWRAHPDRLTVGGGSQTGGPDHLMSTKLAQAVGIDPHQVSYVAHDGGGELLPALVGNEVDFAISGVREYTQQVRSGQLRVLAVSGDARVANLDAPTLTESGIPVVFANWRGVIAPPGITESEKDALIGIFSDLDGTAQWQAELVRNGWKDVLLTGDAFGDFLAEQDRNVQTALRSLGAG